MAQPLKVINVIRTVRQGVSKKTNKPYELILVQTEDGNEVEVFGPVKDGDMVGDITFNAQYDQLQGKVIKADRTSELVNDLGAIKTRLVAIETKLDLVLAATQPTSPVPKPTVASQAAGQARTTPYKFNKPQPAAPTYTPEPLPSDTDRPDDLMEEGYEYDQI